MFRSPLLTGALTLLTVSAAFSYARADAGRHGDLDLEPGPASASVSPDASPSPLPPSQPGSEFTPIQERLPPALPALQISRVISVFGGSVSLAGHAIHVPTGAVTLPTIVTLTLLPDGYVEIELSARLTSLLGRVVDVGAEGLRKPAALTLTYARASNVDDPQRLRIVRVHADGSHELLRTHIDTAARSASTTLHQLSRFRLVAE